MGEDKPDKGGYLPSSGPVLAYTKTGEIIYTAQQWRDFLDER